MGPAKTKALERVKEIRLDGRLTGQTSAPTRVAGLPAPVRHIAAGKFHTGVMTEAGDLLMCGGGEYGHLRLGDEEFALARPAIVGRALLYEPCSPQH